MLLEFKVQDNNRDLHGYSQSTASRCLSQVYRALASLKNDYIKFPLIDEEFTTKKVDFRRKFNMPSIIGAIVNTHIRIKKVAGDYAQLYINRKGFYSINVQVSHITCILLKYSNLSNLKLKSC